MNFFFCSTTTTTTISSSPFFFFFFFFFFYHCFSPFLADETRIAEGIFAHSKGAGNNG